jgi:hypothetical protein
LDRHQNQDAGVVSANVENLKPLRVQVAVEGLGEHLIGGYQGVEDLGRSERDIEVHIVG